jgi:hypothetical protein
MCVVIGSATPAISQSSDDHPAVALSTVPAHGQVTEWELKRYLQLF